MPFAAAISQHPVTALAVGEVAGEVLDHIGPGADLALLFVSPHHAGALEDAAAAIRTLLEPATLLGCAAVAVAGRGTEVEAGPALSLWAGRLSAGVAPVRLEGPAGVGELVLDGWPERLPFDPEVLILLGDPYSFLAEEALIRLARAWPSMKVIGGMASAARQPGGSRLALDGHIYSSGAVAAVLGPGSGFTPLVSQGCRPVGDPLVVTGAERNVILELAGRAPLERLEHLARTSFTEDDVRLVNQGALHIGVVVDEHKDRFGPGDFLVRNVLGADRENGAIAVTDAIPVGAIVQFHVRDAAAADDELRRLLRAHEGAVDGALLFTCNGRGMRLFGQPDHDAGILDELTGGAPAAGFFAAGELGPIGPRNALHSFTASIALFRDR